jgi:hypothetical protein
MQDEMSISLTAIFIDMLSDPILLLSIFGILLILSAIVTVFIILWRNQ